MDDQKLLLRILGLAILAGVLGAVLGEVLFALGR